MRGGRRGLQPPLFLYYICFRSGVTEREGGGGGGKKKRLVPHLFVPQTGRKREERFSTSFHLVYAYLSPSYKTMTYEVTGRWRGEEVEEGEILQSHPYLISPTLSSAPNRIPLFHVDREGGEVRGGKKK